MGYSAFHSRASSLRVFGGIARHPRRRRLEPGAVVGALPVSVSRVGLRRNGKRVTGNERRVAGELVTRGGLVDAACRGEGGQGLTHMGRANATRLPQLSDRQGMSGVGQHVLEL